jgi:hypothetical protein
MLVSWSRGKSRKRYGRETKSPEINASSNRLQRNFISGDYCTPTETTGLLLLTAHLAVWGMTPEMMMLLIPEDPLRCPSVAWALTCWVVAHLVVDTSLRVARFGRTWPSLMCSVDIALPIDPSTLDLARFPPSRIFPLELASWALQRCCQMEYQTTQIVLPSAVVS